MNLNEEQPPLVSGYALGGFREPHLSDEALAAGNNPPLTVR
jgi:hypothetical protein